MVLERIGQGGMGVVYRAFDPNLERAVALKVVRLTPGGGGREHLEREAKTLARLNHPHVLTVHDVGVVAGELFIATEYVDGGTLADWCATHPPREHGRETTLLRLATEAARGLAEAHGAGLVHRDVKPSNLMLGLDGRLRVADFGLARLLGPNTPGLGDRSTSDPDRADIGSGSRAGGTLAYMAPEQIAGRVDARSDQFSWAVTFYEAFAGRRPFDGRDPNTLLQSIRTGRLAASSPGHGLSSPLRRILQRCLVERPEDRYPDMTQVVEQLERLGRGRRWVPWIAGALVSSGVVAWSLRPVREPPCQHAERVLAEVWSEARRDQVRRAFEALDVSHAPTTAQRVIAGLDAYVDAWQVERVDACEATHVRHEQSATLMDARNQCLDECRYRLEATLGLLDEPDAPLVDRAVRMVSELPRTSACADPEYGTTHIPPPDDPAARAEVERQQQQVALARSLADAGRYPEAFDVAERAVDGARSLNYGPLLAVALASLALAQERRGRFADAEVTLHEAMLHAYRAGDDEAMLDVVARLAHIVGVELDRHDEGLRWADLSIATAERLGTDAALRFSGFKVRGDVESAAGRLPQALETLQRALALARQAWGENHPKVAMTTMSIAIVYVRLGRSVDAERFFREAIRLYESSLGPGHPSVIDARSNLGNVVIEQGKLDEGLAIHREALAQRERLLGPQHERLTSNLIAIGSALRRKRQFDAALEVLARAQRIATRSLGPRHQTVVSLLGIRANIHHDRGDHEQAAMLYERAHQVLKETGGPHHPSTVRFLHNLANEYSDTGRHEDAIATHRKVMAIEGASGRPPHPERISTLSSLAFLLLGQSRADEALGVARRAVALGEQLDAQAKLRGEAVMVLARCLWATGDFHDAHRQAALALEYFDQVDTLRGRSRRSMVETWIRTHPLP